MAARVAWRALPFVSSKMLGRRPSSLTGKLREAGLMHAVPARGIDADHPDMVQARPSIAAGFVACGI